MVGIGKARGDPLTWWAWARGDPPEVINFFGVASDAGVDLGSVCHFS